MRKLLIAAAAVATLSTPALAQDDSSAPGEGRIEVRGGYAWAQGADDVAAGVAAGYDFDLGDTVFAGPEVSYDTDFEGTSLINLGLRGGVKAGDNTKLYVIGSYDVGDADEFTVGAGIENKFTDSVYGKVEYRRYLLQGSDLNTVLVGVGIKF